MELSTKMYPTVVVVSPDINNLKAVPCPTFLRQLSSEVLTISHMSGAAPLHFTIQGGGGVVGVLKRCLLHRFPCSNQRLFLLSESYFGE